MQNAKCKIMLANATAMMTAKQSQLCFAYANRNYVPKGNANFTTLRFAHKEECYANIAHECNECISRTSLASAYRVRV